MKITLDADGWHIHTTTGEDVGPFQTKQAAEDFIDWAEQQRSGTSR